MFLKLCFNKDFKYIRLKFSRRCSKSKPFFKSGTFTPVESEAVRIIEAKMLIETDKNSVSREAVRCVWQKRETDVGRGKCGAYAFLSTASICDSKN